jgi:hypothetical protein
MPDFDRDELEVWRRHPVTKSLLDEFSLEGALKRYRAAASVQDLGYAQGVHDTCAKFLKIATGR